MIHNKNMIHIKNVIHNKNAVHNKNVIHKNQNHYLHCHRHPIYLPSFVLQGCEHRHHHRRCHHHQQHYHLLHHQVSCYTYKDVNNWWIIKRPNREDLAVQVVIVTNATMIVILTVFNW